jgi:hypothetical protein
MGFLYIDTQELHLVVILFIYIMETPGPLDIRRSRETPKDETHGLGSSEFGKADRFFTVYITEFKIRGHVPFLGGGRIISVLPGPGLFPIIMYAGHKISPLLLG